MLDGCLDTGGDICRLGVDDPLEGVFRLGRPGIGWVAGEVQNGSDCNGEK